MRFCDIHLTALDILVKPSGDGYVATCSMDVDFTLLPGERCKTLEKWSKVEHAVRGIFNNVGQRGLTAADYILVGDIMVTCDGRYCCKEDDSDSEDHQDDESEEDGIIKF